jgi:hypothetical protein
MPSLLRVPAAAVEGVSWPDDTMDCRRWGTRALKASRAAASACGGHKWQHAVGSRHKEGLSKRATCAAGRPVRLGPTKAAGSRQQRACDRWPQ